MRLSLAPWAFLLLIASVALADQNDWSWKQDGNQPLNTDETMQHFETSNAFDLLQAASENVQQNATDVDKVVDEIIGSQRQGRALQGYDEVYTDPSVQEALQKGDEGEARNVIKDRLCYLGLMQCDEEIEGKRPYISPEELMYAQPVAINPVGRPIPTIPIKGNRGNYGPPRPVPHGNKFGPPQGGKYPSYQPNKPPRRNYGPSFGNTLGGSNTFGSSNAFASSNTFGSSNSFGGSNTLGGLKPPQPPYYGGGKPPFLSGGEILAEGEFLDKPPSAEYFNKAPDSPYQFESHNGYQKDKRVEITVNAQGGLATATASSPNKVGSLEHVHHHYHHNADGVNKAPTVVVNPIPVAAAAVTSLGGSSYNQLSQSSNNVFGSTNGFIPGTGHLPLGPTVGGLTSASYGGQTLANYGSSGSFGGVRPVQENFGPQTFDSGSSGLGSYGSSSLNGNNYGSSAGYYGSNSLYKKELNVDSVNNNYLGSNYAEKYQGVESARAENYDCVCVPYDQCPTHDVLGRKDDLFLAIDPRNLKSDIEAEIDGNTTETRVITDGNGTMSLVRVPKHANATEDASEESKKISKREAPVEDKKIEDGDHKIEGRQFQNQYDNIMKKLKPTFGISFGLPHQGGGGYPFSPQGIYPHHGTVDGTGINLGLVSVNPLVSVQFTKDDYGNKVIKPFVNLHLTPNSYLVHKFEDLVSYKKGVIFNKHKHFHVHKGYPPAYGGYDGPYREHPGEFHHGGPEIIHESHHPHIHEPSYHHSPEFIHHGISHEQPSYHHGHPEISHEPPSYHHGPPEIYDGPPQHYHGPQQHFAGPPEYVPGHQGSEFNPSYFDNPLNYGGGHHNHHDFFSGRSQSNNITFTPGLSLLEQYQQKYIEGDQSYGNKKVVFDELPFNSIEKSGYQGFRGGKSLRLSSLEGGKVTFPSSRRRRDVTDKDQTLNRISEGRSTKRQAYYGRPQTCGPRHVCCRRPNRPQVPTGSRSTCGTRHSQGINGRIKNPVYVDGDSEFGEYPWQVAILKKDPKESVYVCGGTLIDPLHIITAAHCVKQYTNYDLRVRLGEWDVNHDVEFYPYIERDVASVTIHPEFYAGTLANDIAILRIDSPVDFAKYPHIAPACLPHPQDDYSGARCWTTGWGKDAFGDFGKYQNILKEVDVPVIGYGQCQRQLQNTRLGYEFKLHPGFVCAGGEEGKDACKGDGGGPMVCERGGTWQVVGVVSWGIGCGQVGVPGVYVKVAHYLDWIRQVTQRY